MRRFLWAVPFLLVLAVPAWPAEKDSPIVASTRKKLKTAVTVEYNDTRLEEIIEDLKKQVENLSIKVDNVGGVSNNITLSYKAADKPLAEVLDGLFKKADLGYVISKKKDRYEGWLVIMKGKFRGDEEEAAADKPEKPEKTVKDKPPADDAKPKTEDDPDKQEVDAARKLRLAKQLDKDGITDKAKTRYQEIVKKYPNTKAAKEAKQLLEKLEDK